MDIKGFFYLFIAFFGKSLLKLRLPTIEIPIQLDITNACNLSCKHCYHPNHNNFDAIEFDQWIQILIQYKDLLKKLNAKPSFLLCGGEPLVSPFFFEFLYQIQSLFQDSSVMVLTNGTLISEEIIEKLKIYKKLEIFFQVSLDGPDQLRHDSLRGQGQFNRALNGIKLLRRHKFKVHILSVLSQQSKDWIADFFRLAGQLKIASMNFTRYISQRKEQGSTIRSLGANSLKQAYQTIILNSAIANVPTSTKAPLFHLVHPELGSYGHFGKGIVVDYKGNLKVSSRADKIVGNILNEGLETLYLHDPIMKALRSGAIWGCKGCEHAEICGGDRNAAYSEHGDFLAPDPSCWLDQKKMTSDKFLTLVERSV